MKVNLQSKGLTQFTWLESWLNEIITSKRIWCLSGFSVVYFVITGIIAIRKPLWTDEFYTLFISRLPLYSEFWSALLTGADQHPPLFYMITHASLSLFGENELALRVPAILGFWVFCLSLYAVVARRTTVLYGLAAMTFPLVTAAYPYAHEARGYALVLAFTGTSLVCWQRTLQAGRRKYAIPGLALSLFVAVGCHYYALLLLPPLVIGELIRTYTRRFDARVWLALGAAFIPLITSWPAIKAAQAYSKYFWAKPAWSQFGAFFKMLLSPASVPLVAILCAIGLYIIWFQERIPSNSPSFRFVPALEEIAAAVGLIATPAMALVLAKLVTHGFTFRYALPAVAGVTILFGLSFFCLSRGGAIIGSTVVAVLMTWFVADGARSVAAASKGQAFLNHFLEMLGKNRADCLPVVIGDSDPFFRFSYYAPAEVRSRLVYLSDTHRSIRYLGFDTVDRGLIALKPWSRLRVEDYGSFVASHHRFLLFTSLDKWGWLLSALLEDNLQIIMLARYGEAALFLVSRDVKSIHAGTAGL